MQTTGLIKARRHRDRRARFISRAAFGLSLICVAVAVALVRPSRIPACISRELARPAAYVKIPFWHSNQLSGEKKRGARSANSLRRFRFRCWRWRCWWLPYLPAASICTTRLHALPITNRDVLRLDRSVERIVERSEVENNFREGEKERENSLSRVPGDAYSRAVRGTSSCTYAPRIDSQNILINLQ